MIVTYTDGTTQQFDKFSDYEVDDITLNLLDEDEEKIVVLILSNIRSIDLR